MMAIFEIIGGLVTHRYLMNKTKRELEYLYEDNQKRGFGGLLTAVEFRSFRKEQMATEVLRQYRRMPN